MSKAKPNSILWVDDDPYRLKKVGSLLSREFRLVLMHPSQLEAETDGFSRLSKFISESRFDMVVLDYDLKGLPSQKGGSTFRWRAPFLAEALDSDDRASGSPSEMLPVYLISGHFREARRGFDYRGLDRFDRVLTDSDLKVDLLQKLKRDLADYLAIKRLWKSTNGAHSARLLNFALAALRVPADDKQAVEVASTWFLRRAVVVDTSVKDGQGYSSLSSEYEDISPLSFLRWVRFGLMRIPGPLVDTKRAAVALGMTVDAFKRRDKLFSPTRYKGPFADDLSDGLWWSGSLRHRWIERGDELTAGESVFCSVAQKRGQRIPAEVLAFPEGVSIDAPDVTTVEIPVARMNARVDPFEQLPAPFERIYRVQL